MKMFIPALNTHLQVTKDWEISLLCEQRNRSLWDFATTRVPMNSIPVIHRRGQTAAVIIPAGTTLEVARIFIRQGSTKYNSVTLRGWVEHGGVSKLCRFWVLLETFNTMEAEVIE